MPHIDQEVKPNEMKITHSPALTIVDFSLSMGLD